MSFDQWALLLFVVYAVVRLTWDMHRLTYFMAMTAADWMSDNWCVSWTHDWRDHETCHGAVERCARCGRER
jgi:hypothetical protein